MTCHLLPHLSNLISCYSPHLSFSIHTGLFFKHGGTHASGPLHLLFPWRSNLPSDTCMADFVTSFRSAHRVTSSVMSSLEKLLKLNLFPDNLYPPTLHYFSPQYYLISYAFYLFYPLCLLLDIKLHESRYLCLFDSLLYPQNLGQCLVHSRCWNKYWRTQGFVKALSILADWRLAKPWDATL